MFNELKARIVFSPEQRELLQRPKTQGQVELAGTAVTHIRVAGTERFYLQKFYALCPQIRFAGSQQRPPHPMPVPLRQNGHHVNLGGIRRVQLEGEKANRLVGVKSEEGGENGRVGHILLIGFFNAKPVRQRPQNGLA